MNYKTVFNNPFYYYYGPILGTLIFNDFSSYRKLRSSGLADLSSFFTHSNFDEVCIVDM